MTPIEALNNEETYYYVIKIERDGWTFALNIPDNDTVCFLMTKDSDNIWKEKSERRYEYKVHSSNNCHKGTTRDGIIYYEGENYVKVDIEYYTYNKQLAGGETSAYIGGEHYSNIIGIYSCPKDKPRIETQAQIAITRNKRVSELIKYVLEEFEKEAPGITEKLNNTNPGVRKILGLMNDNTEFSPLVKEFYLDGIDKGIEAITDPQFNLPMNNSYAKRYIKDDSSV